ncbi:MULTISPECIES: hypothetical protein [Deferrisoma]
MTQRIPFRRRTFLVKQGFQLRWSLAPVGALLVFLLVAGAHVYRGAEETLRFEAYRPHSRVKTTWELVGPPTLEAATLGGAAAAVVLGAWGLLWFRRLRRELAELASWLERRAEEPGAEPPRFRDPEIQLLAEGLARGAAHWEAWHGELAAAWGRYREAVAAAEPDPAIVRDALSELRRTVARVRVDEGVR